MNIFDQLKGHSIVEANNLTGLRNGHMVAQAQFDAAKVTNKAGAEVAELDNGYILALTGDNKLTLSKGTEKVSFLHYSEEHMKFLDNAPLEMFTVPLDTKDINGETAAYPRAIALYEGDTFTTDNYKGTLAKAGVYYDVTVTGGILNVASTSEGTGPIAKKATLPNGADAIEVVWRGGAI